MKPPYAIRSVPSLSGHAIAYRWRSLPRVRRHRVSKPQGSPERVLPWQVTMDQLICTSLSHTHHWYEVGMLKVHNGGFLHDIIILLTRCYYHWGTQFNPMNSISHYSIYICFHVVSVLTPSRSVYSVQIFLSEHQAVGQDYQYAHAHTRGAHW